MKKNFFLTIKDILYLLIPLWKYAKFQIILQIIWSMIAHPLTTIVQVSFISIVINAINEGKTFREIIFILIFLESIVLFIGVISYAFQHFYLEKKQTEVSAKINKNIYEKSILTDYKYFDDPTFFDTYTWTLNQYVAKVEEARSWIIQGVTYLMTIVALTALIASNDWIIILITVITLIASTYLGIMQNKIFYNKNEESIMNNRKIGYVHRNFYLKDWAAGLKSTRVGKYLFEAYDEAVDKNISIIKKYRLKIFFLRSIATSIQWILNLFIYFYLVYHIINGRISVGNFAGLIIAAQSLKGNLSGFFNLIQRAQNMSIYTEKVRTFFSLESKIENPLSNSKSKKIPEGAFSVELKNIDFSYNNSKFSMRNINLTIEKGKKIAVVGENGGGKTTLTKLLLRLYDPTNGEILINNVSIKDYDVRDLRKSIGVAFQDSLVYALPIAKNMSIYHEAKLEKLQNISRIIGLEHVLKKSNDSLDTEVTKEFDKDGLILSGGEKQKLALSRLFTGEFGLLILDEPASALDPLAEYELNKIIFNKASTTTTIMISHRLSTVREADCIYLFTNGEIAEKGTHEELMTLSGRYYEMFTKQAENYTNLLVERNKIL